MIRIAILTCSIALVAGPAFAQTAPAGPPDSLEILKNRPDAASTALLGGRYESAAAGISFSTPVNCVQVKKNGDEIARFSNEANKWELIATKSVTSEPIPLTSAGEVGDKRPPATMQFGRSGLLEIMVGQIKANNPGVEIVRQDVINVNDSKAGMIAARFTVGTQRRLLQQIIIQANDQLYYSLTLTTPAGKKGGEENAVDPGEKLAVDTFTDIVDSIKLLDLGGVRADQDQRLFRTRALYVNLTPERIKQAIVPEQWLRLLREGKDMGYSYVIEEPDAQGANLGVKIGIRLRTMPDASMQADAESWFFMSFDRKHETFSNLASVQDKKSGDRSSVSEIGSSDATVRRVIDHKGQPGDANDPRQPAVETITLYDLTVTSAGKAANATPLKQQLPPFYMPQALGHMLPRVVPLNQPKTYMFYTYVSDQHKVMARYVDVLAQTAAEIAGKKIEAIPIRDRIGLEGSAIVHYMSPDGKYLGSVNADSQITILPSDAETLQKIWANNAVLTRPAPPAEPPK